jgi:hypothetical protein
VVVGVDGAGRTRRLDELAASASGPVVRIQPPAELPDLTTLAAGSLVVVDDAHRLSPDQLRALTAAARAGLAVVVARRPTIHSPELADLDEAVAARGAVVSLAPLDVDGVGALYGALTRTRIDPAAAFRLHEASGGLPAVVAALAADPATPSPALLARVQRRLALLEPPAAELARLLALRLPLPDPVLRAASELDDRGFAAAMRQLHDAGLLVPGTEAMIPAVAEAVRHDLPAAERRRTHETVAHALVAHTTDVVAAATQLRAARALVPAAATVYAAAGDRVRFSDPGAAVDWYADAIEAGAAPTVVAAGRAEAAALLGLPADPDAVPADAGAAHRVALVDGAVAAHHGRADRSGEALLAVAEPGPLLAVPGLVATGRLDDARAAAAGAGPAPVRLLAQAALLAADDPATAVPRFIEAAEAFELAPPALVLPDTPHALGA